jgi:sn-glycerol 3-phosphate transport system substrate-binding protein
VRFNTFLRWLALAILLLAGCDEAPPPDLSKQVVATSPAAPLTLTFWHTQTGAAAASLNALANDFHRAYPKITVRAQSYDSESDLLRRGIAALAENKPPDLIIASHRMIAEFARKDALASLDSLLNDPAIGLTDADRSDLFPSILEAGRLADLQNQMYAFPFDARAVVMYYNADLLKSAKVDVPPRTWDQFGTAARSTTKGNVRGWAMVPNAAVFYAFLFSRGGSALNEMQTQVQFNGAAGMQTLQLISALSKGDAAYVADNTESAYGDFSQGKTALLFGTTDDLLPISDLIVRTNASLQWGVTNIPQNDPSHPVTAIYGARVAIFRTSNERERAAWLFARWLAAPEQAARWSRTTLAVPVRISAYPLLANNLPASLPLQRLRDGFGNTLPIGRAMPSVKDAALIDVAIVEMWTAVANGTDPTAALNRATQRVNRLLGQMP